MTNVHEYNSILDHKRTMPSYKDNERKTWFCQFYYTDIHGQKKLKKKRGFKTKREADAYEREFLTNTKFNDEIYFNKLIDDYLEDCKSRLKPTSCTQKEYLIMSHIRPVFGSFQLKDITPLMVRKWENDILRKGYKPTYQRQITSILSAIFNYAVKFYGAKENPLKIVGHLGKNNADSFDFWTLDEYKKFLSVCQEKEATTKAMVEVLFWTGLRIGELLALTPEDLDIESKTLTINKDIGRVRSGTVTQTPKTTKSNRTIELTDSTLFVLTNYIERTMCKATERIFDVNHSTLGISINKICKREGLRAITVHQLRHSHRSFLISVLKVSPLYIKERLGHDRIETTLRIYSHLYDEIKEEYIGQMEQYQSGKIEEKTNAQATA